MNLFTAGTLRTESGTGGAGTMPSGAGTSGRIAGICCMSIRLGRKDRGGSWNGNSGEGATVMLCGGSGGMGICSSGNMKCAGGFGGSDAGSGNGAADTGGGVMGLMGDGEIIVRAESGPAILAEGPGVE